MKHMICLYPPFDWADKRDTLHRRLLLEGSDPGAVDKMSSAREVFTALYHHFLELSDQELTLVKYQAGSEEAPEARKQTQLLCVRAMAAIYDAHAGSVGAFDGIPHLLKVLDWTRNRPLRHSLLQLMQRLVSPACAARAHAAAPAGELQRAVEANAAAFIGAGGLEMTVELIATAHDAQERRQYTGVVPIGHLLTADGHEEPPKEWYCMADGVKTGPYTKSEVLELFKSSDKVTVEMSRKETGGER